MSTATAAARYPNPLHATCRLWDMIPGVETVSLTIHDVAGRYVRTLVRGSLEQGAHELVWDGKNHAGRNVGPGTYF